MRITLLLTLILTGATLIFSQQSFIPDEAMEVLVDEKGNIGISAGYTVNGDVKWSGSKGYACLEEELPFSTTTRTRIASISKCFTAIAVMQLVEQQKIDLDSPIQRYLPDFPEKEKGSITVKQLLAHTAGISQYQGRKEMEGTRHYESLQAAMEVFVDRPLLFEPGTEHFYTTYGYVVLGRIIEAVSGMSYGGYMQENIFDVAEMNNTGIESIDDTGGRQSCLYHRERNKTKKGKQNDLSNRVPGGGFYSTMEDLIKFGNAVVNFRFIKESTFQIMMESQEVEYDGNKYGLGWFFYGPRPNENLVIGHSGGQTGCTSQLLIIPKSKTVVVVLSNTSNTYPDIITFASSLIGHFESERK